MNVRHFARVLQAVAPVVVWATAGGSCTCTVPPGLLDGLGCETDGACVAGYVCDGTTNICIDASLCDDVDSDGYCDGVAAGDGGTAGSSGTGDSAGAGGGGGPGDTRTGGDLAGDTLVGDTLVGDSAVGDANSGDSGGPCAARYGSAVGYLLCSSDAATCKFAVITSNYPSSNCGGTCATFGGTCLGAIDNLTDCGEILPNTDDCNTARGSEICLCTP